MLPRFELVGRARPVDLVAPGTDLAAPLAPYLAIEGVLAGTGIVDLTLAGGDVRLRGRYDGGLALAVTAGGRTTHHRSRRWSRPEGPVDAVGLTLTGTHH
ncbi:MAG: hypothetical protein WCS84_15335, partial [Nocardioides sp.]